jgi:hypothetical protein
MRPESAISRNVNHKQLNFRKYACHHPVTAQQLTAHVKLTFLDSFDKTA